MNGTSGYEEAAGQGLYAGINAVRRFAMKSHLFLAEAMRISAYWWTTWSQKERLNHTVY